MKKHTINRILAIYIIISLCLTFTPMFDIPIVRAASTYYVATDGDDTGVGSIGDPFATIQRALNASGDGDTVYVRVGNYKQIYSPTTGLRIRHNNFTLSGYQDEVAIINGNGYSFSSGYALLMIGSCSSSYDCDNVTITNLVFENSSRDIIKATSCGTGRSDNITLDNLTINNATYRGINFWSSNSFTHSINNIEVKDCWINNTQTSLSMGEGITFYGCQNVSFHDNLVTNCPKIMLDFVNTTKNVVCYNNTFVNNVSTAIKVDGSQTENPSEPCYVSNVSIYNNLFYGTGQHAIFISGEKYGGSHNISIYNNIINLSNATEGINAIKLAYKSSPYFSTLDNISVTYNTIYVKNATTTTGVCLQIEIPQAYATNFTVANNIFISSEDTSRQVSSSLSNFTDSYLHFHNNTYNHTSKAPDTYWNGGTPATYQFESSFINASPEFVDIATYNFHLKNTSPCINNATSNYTVDNDFEDNTRPQGTYYDIGAYEYVGWNEGDFISSFDTAGSGNGNPMGVGTNGSHIWVGDDTDNEVYKYEMDGTYVSSFDTDAHGNDYLRGLGTDGSNIWVVDANDRIIYKYDMDGTYVSGIHVYAGDNDRPVGLGTDGSYIWVGDDDDEKIYKYEMDGTYVSSFDVSGQSTNFVGLGTDGNHIWLVDTTDDEVYKYDMDGTYISSFDTAGSGNDIPSGLGTDGSYIWVSDSSDEKVYRYGGQPFPSITAYTPTSGTTNVSNINTALSVSVNHPSNSNMDVRWYSNSSGSWVLFATNTTSGNETCNQINANFSETGTIYYWNVSVTESSDTLDSDIFWFMTASTPHNPTYVNTTYASPNLNITWTTGLYADTTVVVRNNNSVPTSPTDGYEAYNGTLEYYEDANVSNLTFFRLYSYNSTSVSYSTGVNVEWGGLSINCYDEETNDSIRFDVFISNQNGSETYESRNNTNTLSIDVNSTPHGEKTSIRIRGAEYLNNRSDNFTVPLDSNETTMYFALNKTPNSKEETTVTADLTGDANPEWDPPFDLSGNVVIIYGATTTSYDKINITYTHTLYNDRFYIQTLSPSQFTRINAYLSKAEKSNLYRITVVNELDQTVEDVYAIVKKSIEGVFTTISSYYTDGAGEFDLFLMEGETYKFNLSKSGYISQDSDYTASRVAPYTHTFRLKFTGIEPQEPETPDEVITFEGYINNTGYLFLNYTDALSLTLNTNIRVYEINLTAGIEILFTTFTDTTTPSFQVNVSINTTNTYRVVLHYNHTRFGYQKQTLLFKGDYAPLTTETDVNVLFAANYGTNPFGWSNFIMWMFLLAGCVNADNRDAGLMMIFLGGVFLFVNVFIGFNTTISIVAGGMIPVLFIVVGILVMWNDSRKKVVG